MTKAARWILAVVLLVATSGLALAKGVTRAEADAVLARLDRAVAARDTAAIARALAGNVGIDIRIDMNGHVQRSAFGKAERVQGLAESCAQVSEYRYQRTNQTREVVGDQVVATADLIERTVVLGQGFDSRTKEVSTIERIDGMPMITKIVADAVVKVQPR